MCPMQTRNTTFFVNFGGFVAFDQRFLNILIEMRKVTVEHKVTRVEVELNRRSLMQSSS